MNRLPAKSRLYIVDPSDYSRELFLHAEQQREERRRSKWAGVGIVLLLGLLTWFWMEFVNRF